MKDLKARLKTVQELLNHASFIRQKADADAAGEANDWEKQLEARKQELEQKIAVLKEQDRTKQELTHA
jgi:DNA-binding transcriptional MerR regulator